MSTSESTSTFTQLIPPPAGPHLKPIRSKQTQYCLGPGAMAGMVDVDGTWNAVIGQALRISGITPADVTLLAVHLQRKR